MASIFSKRGYLWLGWYEVRDGKKIHPQIPLALKDTKANRKIASDIRKHKEYELRFTTTTITSKITLLDAIDQFLNTKKYKSKKTISIYSIALEKLKALNKKFLKDISEYDIELLIDQFKGEGKSEETIRTYTRHQKIFFTDAIKRKFITSNPVKEFKTKSNNVVKIISDEELDAIFQFFKKRNLKHYYFLRILNSTGLRISEAISLKWNDVNYNSKTITIHNSKGKRAEEIPLLEETEQILKAMNYEAELIFNYKSTDSLKAIKRQLTKFGYTFHDFRRTFGTRWSKELKPFELIKIMRHKDLKTTDKYYIHNELNEIKDKMDGCYLVAEANKKGAKLYKITNRKKTV